METFRMHRIGCDGALYEDRLAHFARADLWRSVTNHAKTVTRPDRVKVYRHDGGSPEIINLVCAQHLVPAPGEQQAISYLIQL
jgi:hypothetical protein